MPNMKKGKKKYKYNTQSIKLGTPYIKAVRENKEKTGVSIQAFIEGLIAKKLKVNVD